jgi:sugar/nucleoside kinase (ribokinase family)
MPQIATVGWLTLDDIVFEDGAIQKSSVGGGALYSAVGAKLWDLDVGIHAVCGRESWTSVEPAIGAYGIDTSGLTPIDGHGLVLWVLNESASVKQQLPKLHSTPVSQLDLVRPPLPNHYKSILGMHVAPQTPLGTSNAVTDARAHVPRAAVSVDILADDFIDAASYADFSAIDGCTIFCPSELEVMRIWRPDSVEDWALETARRYGIHVAVKLGERGAIVCDGRTRTLFHVPIFPVDAIDTTGAGDAFSGGLIAGLTTQERPEIAAAMGAVSASYVVEAHGALNTARPSASERKARLDAIIKSIKKV